ncbi:hypothetical protein PY365_00075 [Roseiarcaceae bacterium H3SJ34-1]|uniref:hypothetical protein n=1 Tax=Terripilifer ovatus TaxID=3032367 RepID=UPI003AB96770|nr:hypothetical protein [Roseiarcaceae bacterium H3SJ34-1]
MNKLIFTAVTAAFLSGLSLSAPAVDAAPANPAPITSQGDNGIVRVQLTHRERRIIRHERRRTIHREMRHERRVMHRAMRHERRVIRHMRRHHM